MRFSPRPYQEVAIERMVETPFQLLALRMGAGKTVCTLTAVDDLMYDSFEVTKTLVVAPKRVAELVWHTEVGKWDHLKDLKVQRVLGTSRERMQALCIPADVYVINRENFCWLVNLVAESKQSWPFDCVIVDENRGFKDRSSKSWKALKAIRQAVKRLFILTGTPDPNGTLEELWPQISVMDSGQRLGKSLTAFYDRWYKPDKRNGHVIYSYKLRPGAREEIYSAVADVMLSVDSNIQLPARIDNVVPVAFDMTRYEEMKAEMVSGEIEAPSAAVLAGKLAQMANGACYDSQKNVVEIHPEKLEALAEILEQGEPVLCFTAYQHDQARILARFPQGRVFDGEESLRDWRAGKVPLLLMHPASGGHGVDGLQDGGSVAVWFGLPFSLDLYEQANARLHRSGQTKGVVVHHLVAQGTIDEQIMRVLETKGDMQAALLDAVRQHMPRKVTPTPVATA
jgi:SNF2 family DNA or RNA helicase